MSIFPLDTTLVNNAVNFQSDQTSKKNEPPSEYAWDFENNDFLLKDGNFIIVKGLEAIKIWIWKALHTQRYRYMAYTWDFGHELENLIGNSLPTEALESECQRYIREALSVNPWINNISNFNISISDGSISADFDVDTPFGEVKIHV